MPIQKVTLASALRRELAVALTKVTSKNSSYEEILALGFKEDPKGSGSRGLYFIVRYVPTAKIVKQGWSGSFDLHIDCEANAPHYQSKGEVKAPDGTKISLNIASTTSFSDFMKQLIGRLKQS